jgi:hypothetical protein
VNVDALQMHLTNLSHLLRDAGGKTTANELDEFVQLLQPHGEKRLKDLVGVIAAAEETLRAAPAGSKRKAAAKVDAGPITSRIVDLYQRAAQPSVTPEEITLAFSDLQSLNLTVAQLEMIAKQIGVKEKLKKDALFNKMRQTVLDRKGATDRVFA